MRTPKTRNTKKIKLKQERERKLRKLDIQNKKIADDYDQKMVNLTAARENDAVKEERLHIAEDTAERAKHVVRGKVGALSQCTRE